MTDFEKAADSLDKIAIELTKALAHCKTASDHFRNQEVPRACAHLLALQGHIYAYESIMKEIALTHALKAG